MEDYEINILRRGGNWKKVKSNDLIIDEINNDLIENNEPNHQKIDASIYQQIDASIYQKMNHLAIYGFVFVGLHNFYLYLAKQP